MNQEKLVEKINSLIDKVEFIFKKIIGNRKSFRKNRNYNDKPRPYKNSIDKNKDNNE